MRKTRAANMLVLGMILCLILLLAGNAFAVCKGTFLNPITDVHWAGMFPIRIGGIRAGSVPPDTYGMERKDDVTQKTPICVCPLPPPLPPRVGIPIQLWVPSYAVEAVKDPWCFPFLGSGFSNPAPGIGDGENSTGTIGQNHKLTMKQSHFMFFLPTKMLDILVDFACLEFKSADFDLAYMTEVDPLWQDDSLTYLIQPENLLFANMIAQMACMADGVSSTVAGLPLDPLFWCSGSSGSVYPMVGKSPNSYNIEAAAHISHKFMAKMARQLIVHDWATNLCGPLPMPMFIKTYFKWQVAKPVAGRQCIPTGRSGMLWGAGKNPPTGMSDNFLFILFTKRRCCAF